MEIELVHIGRFKFIEESDIDTGIRIRMTNKVTLSGNRVVKEDGVETVPRVAQSKHQGNFMTKLCCVTDSSMNAW